MSELDGRRRECLARRGLAIWVQLVVPLAGAATSSVATFNITALLHSGGNLITIRAANGGFGCGAGPYRCNPAGVVFGGSIQF